MIWIPIGLAAFALLWYLLRRGTGWTQADGTHYYGSTDRNLVDSGGYGTPTPFLGPDPADCGPDASPADNGPCDTSGGYDSGGWDSGASSDSGGCDSGGGDSGGGGGGGD